MTFSVLDDFLDSAWISRYVKSIHSKSNMVFRKHKKVNPVITAVSIKPMIQNAACTWVHINDSNMNAK